MDSTAVDGWIQELVFKDAGCTRGLAGLERSGKRRLLPVCIHPLIHSPLQSARLQLPWSIGPRCKEHTVLGGTRAVLQLLFPEGPPKSRTKQEPFLSTYFPVSCQHCHLARGCGKKKKKNPNLQVFYIACNIEEGKESGE